LIKVGIACSLERLNEQYLTFEPRNSKIVRDLVVKEVLRFYTPTVIFILMQPILLIEGYHNDKYNI